MLDVGFDLGPTSRTRTGSRYKFLEMFGRVCNLTEGPGPPAMIVFGDNRPTYRQYLRRGVPYVLVENDIGTLRERKGPTRTEREMIENAASMLLTSEGHLAYLEQHYRLPPHEIVHLRPLAECLDFDPPEKLPRTVVYSGGVVSGIVGKFAYRTYALEIFPAIIAAGWTVHIYSPSLCGERVRAYRDIGCELHEFVPQGELYRELARYAVGFQGYSEHAPQDYVRTCRPNKLWEYLAAGIPTLGYNTGDGGSIYHGRWGLVADTLADIPATLARLEAWPIPDTLRREQVMDNDLDKFARLVGYLEL